jgi:hypothetical protein
MLYISYLNDKFPVHVFFQATPVSSAGIFVFSAVLPHDFGMTSSLCVSMENPKVDSSEFFLMQI